VIKVEARPTQNLTLLLPSPPPKHRRPSYITLFQSYPQLTCLKGYSKTCESNMASTPALAYLVLLLERSTNRGTALWSSASLIGFMTITTRGPQLGGQNFTHCCLLACKASLEVINGTVIKKQPNLSRPRFSIYLLSGTMWIAQFGLVQLGSYNTCNSSTFLASQISINKIQQVTLSFYCMQYHPIILTLISS
jgi:hypothetical protein